ncbi:MAG: ATP-binding protein [Thermoanaerobaculia bacterium]|nr:ATP-binding protein [Thermoanaerobaculia bacterium]
MDLRQLPDAAGPENALVYLQIPEGVVSSLSDANGICWFGTNAHGLRFFNPRAAAFSNFLLNQSIRSKPYIDARGRIWLSRIYLPGADKNSNCCLDPDTRTLLPYPFQAALRDVVASYTVADAAGNLWTGGKCVGRPEYKIICYHQADGRTEVFTFPLKPPDYFGALALRHTAPDLLWVYLPYEMRCLDIQTRIWKSYDYRQLAKDASMVLAVDQTADGSHWIALPSGIIRAQPDGSGNFRFSLLQNDPATRNSIPVNNIKCVATDPVDSAVLWMGTGAGLSRLDTRTGHFTHVTTKNGLPNNVIYGIVPELPVPPEGQVLWLSTNRGLVRFNVNARRFQYFTRSDGLPGDEFNVYAYGSMPDGRLMFGGVEGLTIFNPKQLLPNPHPPRVRLTALRVNGHPLDPRDSAAILANGIEYTERIELGHRRNNLVVEFAALDYANPLRNQFRFYLEGAEPPWTHQGFNHTAQYLNLSPGAYTFHVKAANSDGVWNDTPVSLRIVILPPWYASPLAYALYAILVVAGVYGFYRVQLRRRLEQAEAIRLREIDLVKARLYTNITHEFRTPLTVILGITEQVRQYLFGQGAQAQGLLLEQVKQNGYQLLRLINQMLDLSKIEAGKMAVHWQYGDMVVFIRYIVESYHSYAISRGLELHFTADIAALPMDYDPEKMQTILVNLLSNAMKFTSPGGRIDIGLSQKKVQEGHAEPVAVLIRVSDTGPGIPAEKLPFVFNRFYQADDSPTRQSDGTGIGLALVRELVQLLGGKVSAENGVHGGAIFSVTLPVRHNAAGQPAGPSPAAELPGLLPEAPVPAGLPGDGKPDERPLALVIEDHADLARYVMSCIQDQYRLLLARNGQEGVDMALEHIPDLIVSDVMMPLKDGFEVCAQLKNDERSSHIPVVLLTARTGVHDRIAGLQHGADAYLAKPFHPEELRAVLANLLETRKKLQAKYSNPSRAGTALPESGQGGESPDREDRFLEKIRAVVEENLLQPNLTVEDISRMLGMSYPVVHRKVTALTGRSLTLYVRAVRLRKARVLLADPSLLISDVAYETGFNDPKFFSRVFLEEYGVTPSEYRRNLIV